MFEINEKNKIISINQNSTTVPNKYMACMRKGGRGTGIMSINIVVLQRELFHFLKFNAFTID